MEVCAGGVEPIPSQARLIREYLHLITTDGCFSGDDTFAKIPEPDAKDLEEMIRYEVLKMLKAEGRINDAVIENMLSWRHSGFNVYCGPTIDDPARCIIRLVFLKPDRGKPLKKDSTGGIYRLYLLWRIQYRNLTVLQKPHSTLYVF